MENGISTELVNIQIVNSFSISEEEDKYGEPKDELQTILLEMGFGSENVQYFSEEITFTLTLQLTLSSVSQ